MAQSKVASVPLLVHTVYSFINVDPEVHVARCFRAITEDRREDLAYSNNKEEPCQHQEVSEVGGKGQGDGRLRAG